MTSLWKPFKDTLTENPSIIEKILSCVNEISIII